MPSEFSNARVDLGQERSPDRTEIVVLVKGLCLKRGNFAQRKPHARDLLVAGPLFARRFFIPARFRAMSIPLVIAATKVAAVRF